MLICQAKVKKESKKKQLAFCPNLEKGYLLAMYDLLDYIQIIKISELRLYITLSKSWTNVWAEQNIIN